MNQNNDTISAVAISEHSIFAVGTNEEVLQTANSDTEVIDLQGKTMLPGFIDSHSHVYNNALRIVTEANLNSPPIGSKKCIDDILRELKKRAQARTKIVKG